MTILVSHRCLVAGCPETSHKWEWTGPTLREILQVQETLGMSPAEFDAAMISTAEEGVSPEGARAWLMIVMLLHKRDGIVVAFDDVDAQLSQLEVIADPQPDPAGDAEGKGTPTPTTPSPHPGGGEPTSTSGPSPEEDSEHRSATTPSTSGSSTG